MGRMFRIISDTSSEAAPAVLERPRAPIHEPKTEDVPYIEVGGPEGTVSSIPKPSIRIVPESIPTLLAEPEPELIPTATPARDPMLTVSYHKMPQIGLHVAPDGVSTDVVAFHHPIHPISAEYRLIRDELMKAYDPAGSRILAFASTVPVSGTTTVLLNLAATFGEQPGCRVLILDAHYDRPMIARRLGLSEKPGLAEVLGHEVPLPWALQATPISGVQALVAGIPGDGTAQSMVRDFPRLLVQLRHWFDRILIDYGVWAEALGSEVIGPACDGVYMVTRTGDVDRPDFVAARSSVTSLGGHLRGYITTRA